MGFSVLYGAGLDVAGASAGAAAIDTAAVGIGTAALSAGIGNALSKRPSMPPSPVMPQTSLDQQEASAEQAAQRRQAIAGGLNSTVGTPGGQGGSMLDPSNMSGKSLLGA